MPKRMKLTKTEKLDRQIEGWERKQEGAVLMLRKSAEMLLKLRKQRQRRLARETKALTARDVVWPSGEPVKSGDIESGATLEIEVSTGKVVGVEPPKLTAGVGMAQHLAIQSAVEPRQETFDGIPPAEAFDRIVGDSMPDIPTFLDRTNPKDEAARAEIKAEQAEEKKRKTERRIKKLKIRQETKHAELTGQRRKMPLTGKAALEAIRK